MLSRSPLDDPHGLRGPPEFAPQSRGSPGASPCQGETCPILGPPEFAPSRVERPLTFSDIEEPVGEMEFVEEEEEPIPIDLIPMVPISIYQGVHEKVRENIKDCIDDTVQNLLNEIEKMKDDDTDKYLKEHLISCEALKDVLLKILNVIGVKREEYNGLITIYEGIVEFEEKNKPMNIQLNVNEPNVDKETIFEDLEAIPYAEDVVNDFEDVNAEAKSLSEIEIVQMYPANVIGENIYAAIDSMQSNEVTMGHLYDLKEALTAIKIKDFDEHNKNDVISVPAFQAMKQRFSDVLDLFMKPYHAIFQYLQEICEVVKKSDPLLIAYPKFEEDRQKLREVASRK